MLGSFLDTSALAKHYHQEIGSAEVDRRWADSARDLFVSRVGVVEAISVFAGKVRTGELSPAAFAVLRKRFLSDVGSGRPKLIRLLVGHFKDAERLIGQHGLARRIRTLDALQLAVALELQRRGIIRQAPAIRRYCGRHPGFRSRKPISSASRCWRTARVLAVTTTNCSRCSVEFATVVLGLNRLTP